MEKYKHAPTVRDTSYQERIAGSFRCPQVMLVSGTYPVRKAHPWLKPAIAQPDSVCADDGGRQAWTLIPEFSLTPSNAKTYMG